ncbi:MAG: flippase-like domain-containing protein [Deltaproteobacteria bacterium]|uniref:Flippase-like domain-containing protein n=1 Tax=Candidatus Zymogenus saltonus TaxID=2844893 RepID=A0A9D8PP23_9DELT|nr:flippase-like domain-containing protein [Candidatus Zymogenus saltonus]
MKLDWKFYLGLIIGFTFLFFSLRGFDYVEFYDQLKRVNWFFIILSVFIYYLTYVSRVLRWRYLTLPIKEMSFRNLFSGIAIGFGANNMLPMRLGELIRAYALGKIEKVRAGSVLATVVIERVFDGMAVIALLVVIFFGADSSERFGENREILRTAGYSSLAFLVFMVGFLVLLERKTDRMGRLAGIFFRPLSRKLQERMERFVKSFAAGLDVLYRGGALLMIVFYTILTWLLITFFYYTIILSFPVEVEFAFSAAIAVVVFIAFASVIPAPPGYVGTFEVGGISALMIYGLAKSDAAGVVLVMHALNIFPAIIMGLIFLWLDKMSLAEVSRVSVYGIEGEGGKE